MAEKDGAPNPGPDDCYNRVTQTCNSRHPGQDMGDAEYRNCIESGMDWCDANEPVEGRRDTFPILVQGRFQVAALRMRDSDAPDPGSGDCYNRVTETCNRKHPGKDMGDPEYRSCINDGLDWCDIHEPLIGGARVFPILVGGRMKVLDR